jgi:thioredoxin reductase
MSVEVIMTQKLTETFSNSYDVAVVGGGAAGLSGALVLARARRSVIVIDGASPRNARADGVHGFLTRDGMSPSDLVQTGHKEVARYGGHLINAHADSARRTAEGFEVTLDDGRRLTARRLLVTTGLVDELPDVPGVREQWGRDVLHCPYCHGWEFRDRAVGILGTSAMAIHQALLFRQWTSDLVFFAHTAPGLTPDQAEELAALGIQVVSGLVESLEVVDGRLSGVRLQDGTIVARQAFVVSPRLVAQSQVLTSLGIEPTDHPMGIGAFIAADASGLTAVPGVWVAGNVTDLKAQVVTSASGGVVAAAAINADLVAEDTQRAVTAYRSQYVAA